MQLWVQTELNHSLKVLFTANAHWYSSSGSATGNEYITAQSKCEWLMQDGDFRRCCAACCFCSFGADSLEVTSDSYPPWRGGSNQEIYPRVFSICQFLQSQREEQKPAKSFQTFLKYFRNQRLSMSNLCSPRGLHHRTAEPIEDMAQCLSIGSYLKTNLWWRMKIEWRPSQMLGTLVRKQALLPYLSSPVIFVNCGFLNCEPTCLSSSMVSLPSSSLTSKVTKDCFVELFNNDYERK